MTLERGCRVVSIRREEGEEVWLTGVLHFTCESDLLVSQDTRRGNVQAGHSRRRVYFGNTVGISLGSDKSFPSCIGSSKAHGRAWSEMLSRG